MPRSPSAGRPCRALLALALASLLSLAGCGESGPERAAISGTITLNGEPVPLGTITFNPWRGTRGPRASTQIRNGQYSIRSDRGPLVGQMQVRFSIPVMKPGQGTPENPHDALRLIAEADESLPDQFGSKSEIGYTVKSGDNRFDYDIQVKPKDASR